MPPSPGQLHQLPVKVLYQLDGTKSSNSFATVLSELQSVYVHPQRGPHGGNGDELYASCALKAVGRAVCFASPELVPVPSQPDSSLYVLDPREPLRPRSRSTSPSSSTTHFPVWTGKGLLSWLLAEAEPGKSLAMGRLTRSWEFSASSGSFSLGDEGGLEGLMAAANAASEDEDGMGWGLEIALSLREAKNPPVGRRELHETLERGVVVGDAGSPVVSSGPRHQAQVPLPVPPRPNPPRPVLPPKQQWSGSTASVSTPAAGPSRPIAGRGPPSQTNFTRAPSSGPSQPPRQPEASGSNWQRSTPTPATEPSRPVPQRPQSAAPNLSQPVQPSPLSQSLQPPSVPPSPNELLSQLLPALKQASAGNTLSPEVAKQISSNPALLKLLKSMAPTPTAANVPSPLETKPSPAASTTTHTPMPQSTPAAIPVDVPSGTTPSIYSAEPCYNCGTHESACWRTKKLRDGQSRKVCDECGMYFNQHKRMRPKELWADMPPKGQDMTPVPEPQSSATTEPSSDPHPAKRAKLNHTPAAPPQGVRSSPRHSRTPGKTQTTPRKASQPAGRPLPPPPPSPSPRRTTRSTVAAKTPSPRKGHRAEPPSTGRTRAGAALARACNGHDLRSGSSAHSQRDGSTTPTPNGKASRTAASTMPAADSEANDTEWATDFSAWNLESAPAGENDLFEFHFPGNGETDPEGGEGLVISDDLFALLSEINDSGGG